LFFHGKLPFPREIDSPTLARTLAGLPEALGAHLDQFSSFFITRTRDVSQTFHAYVRGLFQSERGNMLRMSEVNAADH